jgi:hypothetical protein
LTDFQQRPGASPLRAFSSKERTIRRRRKLTADGRRILALVFKDCGADWTYKALAVWYGNPFEELANVKPWPKKSLAAFYFLRDITREYTFKAVYDAALEIETPAHMKKTA